MYLVSSTKNLTKFLKVTQQIVSKMKHQSQGQSQSPCPVLSLHSVKAHKNEFFSGDTYFKISAVAGGPLF